jgi:predicted GTPase
MSVDDVDHEEEQEEEIVDNNNNNELPSPVGPVVASDGTTAYEETDISETYTEYIPKVRKHAMRTKTRVSKKTVSTKAKKTRKKKKSKRKRTKKTPRKSRR